MVWECELWKILRGDAGWWVIEEVQRVWSSARRVSGHPLINNEVQSTPFKRDFAKLMMDGSASTFPIVEAKLHRHQISQKCRDGVQSGDWCLSICLVSTMHLGNAIWVQNMNFFTSRIITSRIIAHSPASYFGDAFSSFV